jgi:hypothetical protein
VYSQRPAWCTVKSKTVACSGRQALSPNLNLDPSSSRRDGLPNHYYFHYFIFILAISCRKESSNLPSHRRHLYLYSNRIFNRFPVSQPSLCLDDLTTHFATHSNRNHSNLDLAQPTSPTGQTSRYGWCLLFLLWGYVSRIP